MHPRACAASANAVGVVVPSPPSRWSSMCPPHLWGRATRWLSAEEGEGASPPLHLGHGPALHGQKRPYPSSVKHSFGPAQEGRFANSYARAAAGVDCTARASGLALLRAA